MKLKIKEHSRKRKPGILHRPACLLWRARENYRKMHPGSHFAREEGREVCSRIYGSTKGKERYREYQIQKQEKLLAVFLGGMGLAALLTVVAWMEADSRQLQALKRPEAGSSAASYELNVRAGEEMLKKIPVTVQARQLSQEEEEQLLEKGEEELPALFLERIPEPENICRDVSLPEACCNGLVEIRWESSNYEWLDGTGHIGNGLPEETGEAVTLTAVMTCGGQQKYMTFPVRVMPKGQDAASRLARETARKSQEEEMQPGSESFVLPEEFDGLPLMWQLPEPAWGIRIALLTLAGCAGLSAAFDRDLRREGEKREEALMAAYPAFLSRLVLLAGTGMPLRMIFARLAKEGMTGNGGPVYEEALRTFREMESGLTELEAYENFGRRTRLPQYRKCASLLAQNVRKGTGELLTALEQEAENAFEERKARARKKGEEAQTRLLLPMLLMLVVVMILIMVPACFSFGGI